MSGDLNETVCFLEVSALVVTPSPSLFYSLVGWSGAKNSTESWAIILSSQASTKAQFSVGFAEIGAITIILIVIAAASIGITVRRRAKRPT